jgi:hypothetical protein
VRSSRRERPFVHGRFVRVQDGVIKAVRGFPSGLISADMDVTWAMHAAAYKPGYAGNAVALVSST